MPPPSVVLPRVIEARLGTGYWAGCWPEGSDRWRRKPARSITITLSLRSPSERRPRAGGKGREYCLTPAGGGLRAVIAALGQWGMTYTHDRIKRSDLDPALLIWGLRRRVDVNALPDRRVVLRFEFSGVPASRTKFRIMWLILGRSSVDVCMKDPGFDVDLTLRGNIRDYVEVYLGQTKWNDAARAALQLHGDRRLQERFLSGCN
jgi:hypothetical protein